MNRRSSLSRRPLFTVIPGGRQLKQAELLVAITHAQQLTRCFPGAEGKWIAAGLNRLREEVQSSRMNDDQPGHWEQFAAFKLQLRQYVRSSGGAHGDWQSPAMSTSGIKNTESDLAFCQERGADYKRYLHKRGVDYEKAFADEFLSPSCKESHRVLLCNSGMAAISASLHALSRLRPGAIVADKGLYHETKFLLGLFPGRVTFIDFTDVEAVAAAIEETQPSLVMCEPLRNSAAMTSLSLERLRRIAEHAAIAQSEPILWIDDSASLSTPEILEALQAVGMQGRTVIVTSLLKLHQQGMDLVSGGLIVAPDGLVTGEVGIEAIRTHTGVNCPDTSVALLPPPSSSIARERLAIITRNARLFALTLSARCEQAFRVVSPWTDPDAELPPSGFVPYFNLIPDDGAIGRCQWVVHRSIEVARQEGIELHAGTSFGFDVSRLYVVESRIPGHVPFFRVAPGIEPAERIRSLADIIGAACQQSTQSLVQWGGASSPSLPTGAES